jgi:SNF2 family DNA or RNA helicase
MLACPRPWLANTNRYKYAVKRHEELVAAGRATEEDEIKMLQLHSEYDARKRKRKEDKIAEQEERELEVEYGNQMDSPLFEPQDEDDNLADLRLSENEVTEFHSTARPRRVSKSETIKLSQRSRAMEEDSMTAGLEQILHGKRKAKGTTPKSRKSKDKGKGQKKAGNRPDRSSGTSKGKGKEKVKDPQARVTKKKMKKDNRPRPSMARDLDVPSLFTSNVIRDAQGNDGAVPLPNMSSNRKQEALRKLVASVPQELRKTASIDRNYLLAATRDFVGQGSCKAVKDNDGWQLKGMKSLLKHHQLIGASFMRRRERGDDEPRGGLCADQMGLGKTVMALANIVNGRPGKYAQGPRATLIVATPALVGQWFDEIEKHCDKKFIGAVLKHFGKHKLATNDAAGHMSNFDIILTTYDEVRKSYPKADFPIELQTAEEKSRWWKKHYMQNRGILHEVRFLRVILDEAQCIKNHKTWTSIAARGLQADHRWALSGTPIQNSIQELYPYFKFLRVPHTGSFRIFCANFTGANGPKKSSFDRLHSFLSRFMIRRTHLDSLLGAPIITLPKATENLHWCKFNEVERVVYETVRRRMIQRINKLSRSKELDSHYSNILTMLLRLRQLTCHILMLEQPMRDLLEREDHEKLYDLARDEVKHTSLRGRKQQMQELRKFIFEKSLNASKKGGSSGNTNNLPPPSKFPGVSVEGHTPEPDNNEPGPSNRAEFYNPFEEGPASLKRREDSVIRNPKNIGKQHGLQFDFLRYLATLRDGSDWDELQNRTLCVSCNDKPENPWVTSCYHVYCYDCLIKLQSTAAKKDNDRARCADCGIEFTDSKPCDKFDLDAVDEDSDTSDEDRERLRRHKKNERGDKCKDWIDMQGLDILPSSKTIAIKAQIINWIEEDPKVKIIIYTQFIDMIRIMSKICQVERWKYTTYHGGKSHEARDKAIKQFGEQWDLRIMIASLKCGGIGLNLTMAQKVIVVDPWWNSSVEQQAFCRVFRIGQAQETSMTRFVVEKTVDENMVKMQDRKQHEIDQVMDGNRRRK